MTEPAQKLLLSLLEQAFSEGWRGAEDFLRHFPPAALVESLASEEDVRVKLITATTGVHEKLARRKSVASAADDLTLALEESTTTPSEVLGLYAPEIQVRCLPRTQLWQFLTETPFWSDSDRKRAVERMLFTIESAVNSDVLTMTSFFDGLGFEELARALPKSELEQLLVRALEGGRSAAALTEEVLLDVVPLRSLVATLDLATLWDRVVIPRIAEPAGFLGGEARPVPTAAASPAAPRKVLETLPGEELLELDSQTPQDEGLVRAVRERLAKIDRLPRNENLPLAVLTSIESMYEDLKDATTDEERTELIREAFPNETFLRIGALALIELLDPSIDVSSPNIRNAEIDSLLKIVLFEERKRRSTSKPASLPPPPPGGEQRRARSLAPPPRKKTSATANDESEIDFS